MSRILPVLLTSSTQVFPDSAFIGGGAFLRGKATFEDDVVFRAAKIGTNFEADGSAFNGALEADGIEVTGSVFLRDKAEFAETVDFNGSRVGGGVYATNAKLSGTFRLDRANVEGSVLLDNSSTFEGDVLFAGLEVGRNIDANSSIFGQKVDLNGARIGNDVRLNNRAVFDGAAILRNAVIGGSLSATGSTFKGDFVADGATVGSAIFLREGATFEKDINLIAATIGRHLQFGASTFNGRIELDGAEIGGELMISSPGKRHGHPKWGPDAHLVLRNVKTDVLQAELAGWFVPGSGDWVSADLTGLQYKQLGGLHAKQTNDSTNMAYAASDELIAWIKSTQPDHDARYDPQPYQQLAAVLEAQGAPDRAREIRFAMYDHRRLAANTTRTDRALLSIYKATLGYGLYPFRLLYFFGILVTLGWIVGLLSKDTALQGPVFRFWYSLQNSLPLFELRGTFKTVNHGSDGGAKFVEGWFHFQRILGFIMASILVGALTLLSN